MSLSIFYECEPWYPAVQSRQHAEPKLRKQSIEKQSLFVWAADRYAIFSYAATIMSLSIFYEYYNDIERLRRSFRCFSVDRGAVLGLAFERLVVGALLCWRRAFCLSISKPAAFYHPPGKYSKNCYAILPPCTEPVSRKGRRGKSKKQRRKAKNAYLRRELAAGLMAGENKDLNAEADAWTYGTLKIFWLDESIFSHFSDKEIERLLIGSGRKRQIRRVKRMVETGKSRRACAHWKRQASYRNEQVKKCLTDSMVQVYKKMFTYWKENWNLRRKVKKFLIDSIIQAGRKLFAYWKENTNDSRFTAAKSKMLKMDGMRAFIAIWYRSISFKTRLGKKLARRCVLRRPFCCWRNFMFRDMHIRSIAFRIASEKQRILKIGVVRALRAIWHQSVGYKTRKALQQSAVLAFNHCAEWIQKYRFICVWWCAILHHGIALWLGIFILWITMLIAAGIILCITKVSCTL